MNNLERERATRLRDAIEKDGRAWLSAEGIPWSNDLGDAMATAIIAVTRDYVAGQGDELPPRMVYARTDGVGAGWWVEGDKSWWRMKGTPTARPGHELILLPNEWQNDDAQEWLAE
jgi:hypothetical protein